MSHRYDAEIADFDPTAENDSHVTMVRLVGEGKRVLDVGCATGRMARALTAVGCVVSGIDFDAAAAEEARDTLKTLVIGDLNSLDLLKAFGTERFDVMIFGDVLEHVTDPKAVLVGALRLLAPGGSIVLSIPNVAHSSVRLGLLQGSWTYTETGLLDETHVRFFTPGTVLDLMGDAGLVVLDYQPTRLGPFDSSVHVDAAALPRGVVNWVKAQPGADIYQVVLQAIRADDERVGPGLVAANVGLRSNPSVFRAPAADGSIAAEPAPRGVRAVVAPPRRVLGRIRRRIRGW